MLVLSRRPEESIVIDANIRITLVAIKGRRIVLGIEAPPDISILRGELQPAESSQRPMIGRGPLARRRPEATPTIVAAPQA